MTAIKKQYALEGLCCGNCAAEIEREIGRLDGVSSANVNFASKLLTVELDKSEASETVAEQAREIVKRHDPDIRFAEREIPQAGSKTMLLLGLDCADCAQKIESAVSRLDGVASARVDFVTQRLTINAVDQKNLPALLRKASETIHELEPDVEISYSEAGKASEEASPKKKERLRLIGMAAGAALFAAGLVLRLPQPAGFVLFFISYLLIGGEIILRALKNMTKGRVFDENFLMSVATVGAFAIGDFAEGVAVMLFYQVGEFFQNLAVNHSRKSISALMDIRPDYANLKLGEEVRRVSPEEVGVGDQILIRPGEKVPLDGRVVEGVSSLDTAALTGESLPRDVEPGNEVLSGSVNKGGLLTLEVTKEFGESTVSRILDLVQNAGSRKAPTENFITKFAGYYTPVVVFAALALALIPPLAFGDPFPVWINRALTFLVVSCPCALVISIPLSFFGGIGAASRQGILIKGSSYLEALNRVDTVVFDKTGTLTKGSFRVAQINPAKGWTPDDILSYAAHAELYSSHPIAVSIREAYGRKPDAARVADYQEIPGKGVRVTVNGKTVLAGSAKLMDMEKIAWQAFSESGTFLYLAIGGVFAGSIVIADEVKPDSARAIESLKSAGVRRTVLLTGDNRTAAETVARALGLDAVYPELLPQQKVEQLELLNRQIAKDGKLVFVGDGINDAPVLARADIGIAMGGLGSDAAIEAADIVLMTDEPSKIAAAIRIAKRTRSIVRQNIVFALGVKLAILILAAFGIATMWAAVFGDVGVTIIAVLNAMRTMHVK